MHRRKFIKTTGTAGLLVWLTPSNLQFLSETGKASGQNFQQPPFSAYPKVIWFWMNGNITKQGITLDLEAMKRIGISGVFSFDAGENIPKGPVEYLSKEWIGLKRHAVQEAARLGMSFVQHNCPGWSASGGPWITPQLAMQQITWSEVFVEGGRPSNIQVPRPAHYLDYYKDIAILAFPSLQGEAPLSSLLKELSGSNEKFSVRQLYEEGVTVLPQNNFPAYLQFEFREPYEAHFINFYISSLKNTTEANPEKKTSVWLQSSDDGIKFNNVVEINTGLEPGLAQGNKFITFDIPFTRAKFFRLVSDEARKYREVKFSGVARLDRFMEKAGFRFMFNGDEIPGIFTENLQVIPKTSVINPNTILELTPYLNSDGKLNWQPPEGNWTVLRIGFTPTGSQVKAAPDKGRGLECDKFSKAAFDFHFNEMMKYLLPALNEIKARIGLEIDSYEADMQNWTPEFAKEFQNRRGYDLIKYLPAVTGRVIDSVDLTESFLWDFRRTQADLIAENYYGRFTELCHQHGFSAFMQPYERGPMEEMQVGARSDEVLGEFWNGIFSVLQNNVSIQRIPKLVSSIAHVNGKKLVAAEAFTSEAGSSQWQEYPFSLKASGDHAFTRGINQLIIHCYTHQPHATAKPGLSLGSYGIHFDRTNTWWNAGRPWMNYLARCQYLLQSGLFVADLLYFTGEESHLYTKADPHELDPPLQPGFDYDLVNADTILKRMKIVNGNIVLPGGMNYRIMVFQKHKGISLRLLQKIHELVQEGMILVGEKPLQLLGIHSKDDASKFQTLVNDLWEATGGSSKRKGKGLVFRSASLNDALQQLHMLPDFLYTSRSGTASVKFIHRKEKETDVYFVINRKRNFEELVCRFRVENKLPQLWDPVTGKIVPVALYETMNGCTNIPIQLQPLASVFVVFAPPVNQATRYESVIHNAKEIISAKNFPANGIEDHKGLTNNFTISFRVKPEIDIMLKPSVYMANIKNPWTDAYAIYPPAGKNRYGNGHASCGIAVGRNGIAVWENAEVPVLVLPVEIPVAGWNHVALIYRGGTPEVYVNGRFIKRGNKSQLIVHPALGKDAIPEEGSFFIGDMTMPVLHNQSLNADQVSKLSEMEPLFEWNDPPVIPTEKNKKPALLIRKNGSYTLKGKTKTNRFNITNIEGDIFLQDSWQVQFPGGASAPSQIIVNKLSSLHLHGDNGVKYFSGTAAYSTHFILPDHRLLPDKLLFLDLGRVEVIAEVIVNEKNLGIFWTRPYRIDITKAVKAGRNKLVVRVTNLWINRLIGDEQAEGSADHYNEDGSLRSLPRWFVEGKQKPRDGRISFTAWKHYSKNAPLTESGLIGPVVIQTAILKSI